MKIENPRSRAYKIVSMIILVILAILFLFPLYWIITGAFKPAADIYAQEPVLWPTEWVSKNFENLFNKRTAPLFSIFGIEGPTGPWPPCSSPASPPPWRATPWPRSALWAGPFCSP